MADVHRSFDLDGKIVEETLDKICLTLNKNSVPDDTLPPFKPSGIRLGTPAITTRGLKACTVADWMKQAIDNRDDSKKLSMLRDEVTQFALTFPLPSDQ